MPRPVERFPVNIRPDLAAPRTPAPPAPPRAKVAADDDATAAAGWSLLLLLAAAGTAIGFLLPLP